MKNARKSLIAAGALLILIAIDIPADAQETEGVSIDFDSRVPEKFSERYSNFNALFGAELLRLLKGNVFKKHEISVKFATMSYKNSKRLAIIAIIIDGSDIPAWVIKFKDLSSPSAIEKAASKTAHVIYTAIKKTDGLDDQKIEASSWNYPRAFTFVENE